MDRFSPYEYLAFLLPGGTLVWSTALALGQSVDLGLAELALVLGLAFVVGHGVAAVASWSEPVAWGQLPGGPPNPLWGFKSDQPIDDLQTTLQERLKVKVAFPRLHRLAYTRLQQLALDEHLQVLNQQIGFYRNMVVALALGALAQVTLVPVLNYAPVYPWPSLVALEVIGAGLFAYRYRRFWVQFGAAVVNGILVVPQRKLDEQT